MDDKEWQSFLAYISAVFGNLGNYKTNGDQKFIPGVSKDKLTALVVNSKAFKVDKDLVWIWDHIRDRMYSLEKNELTLGFTPNGTNAYFSKNCTEEDSKLVKEFMELNKIDAYNSRVFKTDDKSFEIRFASVVSTEDPEDNAYLQLTCHDLKGHRFVLSRGDYSPLLKLTNKYLSLAEKKASNDTERQMIGEYVKHFNSGDIAYHKNASRLWIKDKGPVVETYIGFYYTYMDPGGMRGRFQAFVGIVDKDVSKKLSTLVANGRQLLAVLPWGEDFETDHFLEPDFTSVDVLMCGDSDICIGINYPPYDHMRQTEGFKNLLFANSIKTFANEKPNFLSADDSQLFSKYLVDSCEIVTALHELLGHGSGKLLKEDANQELNFDINKVVNPLTNDRLKKWYKSGETFLSVFTSLAGPLEECKAECVGLLLGLEPMVLNIFGHTGEEAERVQYVLWLDMVVSGVESLKAYNPSVKKWLQPHSQARHVITRVLLESSQSLVAIDCIDESQSSDGKPDLLIRLNRHLIRSEGREAIKQFLLKLQVFKSSADFESAKELFDKYSEVTEEYLKYRSIVLNRQKPRKFFVQPSTHLTSGGSDVALKSYSATYEGLIESFGDHLKDEEIDEVLVELWRKDCKHFA